MIDGYVSGRISVILDFKMLSTIINGLCTSCCALEAEALLRRICKYSRGIKGFRSIDDLLQAVLKALNVFGMPGLAASLLESMKYLYDARELDETPSRCSYGIVVEGMAHSKHPNKNARARMFRLEMDKCHRDNAETKFPASRSF